MPIICNIGSAEYRYRLIFQTLISFALYLVGVVELDEEDDCDGLQVAVTLLVLGLGRHRVAELGEELRHDRRDALVDPVLVHLQGRIPMMS